MHSFYPIFRISLQGMVHSMGFRRSKRSKADRSGWLNLLMILGLNLLMAVLYGLPIQAFFNEQGFPLLGPALMGLMGASFCVLLTLTGARDVVFNTKDMDLVLSLPVAGTTIMVARVGALYLENLAIQLTWSLTAAVGWAVQGVSMPWFFVPLLLPATALAALLPTMAALVVSYLLAWASGKLARPALVEGLLYLLGTMLFVGVSLLGSGTSEQALGDLTDMWLIQPYEWLTQSALGDARAWLLLAVLCLMPAGVLCLVLGRCYRTILASLSVRVSKGGYQLTAQKNGGVLWGFLKKEASRYVNTPIYLFNTGVGLLLYLAAGVASVFQGQQMLQSLAESGLPTNQLLPIGAGFAGFVLSMTAISASSISLEGNTLWILKTLPISTKQLLHSKVLFHWLVCAPFMLLGSVLLGIGFGADAVQVLLLTVLCLVYSWVSAQLGLLVNLRWPKLDAVNPTVVVKQSAAVALSMLGDILELLLAAAVWFIGAMMSSQLLGGCLALGLLLLMGLVHQVILNQWGIKTMDSLEV